MQESAPQRRSGRPRVLVLGGGFAGVAAAQALPPDRLDVTLVDRRSCFEWLPNIHELVSGVKTPELLRLPLERIARRAGHRFLCDAVTAIETAERRVHLRSGPPLRYDALVLALGGVDASRGVEGVREHALPFKSVEQCARIGRRLEELAGSGRRMHVVIVGGGLEGIESLGEILRRHREDNLHVTLVEAGDRLLPEAPPALHEHVRRLCAPWPVDFELGRPVERIEAEAVVLADGRALRSELTLWTGGPAPSPLLAESGLAPAGAWAPVDTALASRGHPGIFVAGDAAELPEALSKQAYHALDMGTHAARNARRWLSGGELRAFRPSPKPMLLSFGDLSCFLVAGELVLAGPALSALKETVFELGMTRLDAQPWWRRLPGVAQRAELATRRLLWPTLSSLESIGRQARLSLLSTP